MKNQMVFKRYEMKYLLSASQYTAFKEGIEPYMSADSHGRSTILSLYMDTPDFQLIRTSMEKPFYKEKIRLRSYGVAKSDGTVFLELKKKYDSVVYKRREEMTLFELQNYLTHGITPKDTQIMRELHYSIHHYPDLAPRMMLTYEREAYYGHSDPELRITMDQNILWRTEKLSLGSPVSGKPILPKGQVLLEIKVATALPLWLVKLLSDLGIQKTSFSKYANAYLAYCKQTSSNTATTRNQTISHESSDSIIGGFIHYA